MVEPLIDVASGPWLRFALIVMALGLARVLLLQVADLAIAWRRAGDQVVTWPLVLKRTLAWATPVKPLRRRDRIVYNLASIVFHAGVLIVPLFFLGHVALWERSFGIAWPALPGAVSDALSLAAAAALALLIAARAAMPAARRLSRTQDWVLPSLCLTVFLTGLASAHPTWSPISARTAYLLHLLSAELLLVLVPFSKLQHVVLFWTNQASTELGWRFSVRAGERVRLQLGRQEHGV